MQINPDEPSIDEAAKNIGNSNENSDNISKTYYQPRGSSDKLIKSKEKTSGALNLLSNFISTGESDDPSALIDIKITNPLKRIYELIQEIKKHQATTFSLKFTIPLIALPIFLYAGFQVGKGQGICQQVTTSKVGVIKNIMAELPQNTQNFLNISWPGTSVKYAVENRTLLVDLNGESISVLNPKKIDIGKYSNQNVIITGLYSSCAGIITVVSDKNISAF